MHGQHIPILRMGHNLIVSIQMDLHDELAISLKDDLANEVRREETDGVVLDVSALRVLDSFVAHILGEIASTSSMLGANTVIVGIRPAVAITLVELGVTLEGVHTALDLDSGMLLLDGLTKSSER